MSHSEPARVEPINAAKHLAFLRPLHEATRAGDAARAPSMKIRSADRADASAVNELLHQLGYPQDDQAATANRIQTWAEDSSSAAYVAEAGAELLGVVAVHICPYFERDGCWGRITALVVSDRARGRGVGSHLVAAAESFAANCGCDRMEVSSGDHRQGAHEFYRRRGYIDQAGKSSRFRRDLPITPCQTVGS